MRIGEKIRSLRKNKNITQTQLAEVLSVSAQSVSKWENHISVPDISVLPVIARYFGEGFTAASLGPYAGVAQQFLFYYERWLGGEQNA